MDRFRYPALALVGVVVAGTLLWQAGAQTTAPPLTRYPYLQDMRTDRVTIVWTMPELVESPVVEYSTDQSFRQSVPAQILEIPPGVTGLGIPYYKYQVTLTGLRPGTEYFYRVLLDGGELAPPEDLRFRTAAPGPFQFLAFGDSGTGGDEQRRLALLINRERPALVIHTGDIAYPDGTFSEFRNNHFAIYSPLMRRVPFFPSPGNHEYNTPAAIPYVLLHTNPTEGVPEPDQGRYYSFDWGDVHFVSVDTNAPFARALEGRGQMIRWLEEDLRRTRRLWRVVYFHHPVRPTSNHENDPTSAQVRQHLEPIFDRHDVQLIFGGHEHNYQQAAPRRGGEFVGSGQGTVNIITGGGGAILYSVTPRPGLVFGFSDYHYLRCEVDGPRLTIRAIDIQDRQQDQFTVTTPPLLSRGGVVNAASFSTALAPGSLISIFGRRLSTEEAGAGGLPLPSELGGTTVTIGDRRLPLLFVSRGQINAQIPFDVQGSATLRVAYAGGAAEVPITISDPAPAIFSAGPDRPAVIHSNGTLVSEAAPARPGEVLTVFLTGLGRPEREIVAGTPAPASPLISARGPIEALVGPTAVTPSFAGLTPGFAGLYQVNLQVPADAASGSHGLRIVARGISSNTVSLAVRR
jgi:uncharacterized protein (TIGR03437 family)